MITSFLTSKFSGYLSLIGVAIIIGLIIYIYQEGKNSCINHQSTLIVKEIKKNERKEIEIRRLSDDDLVKRYCKWVYDVPFEQCIKDHTNAK